MNTDPFDSATYCAVGDSENLTHDSVTDAIQQHLDDCGELGETLRETIQREAPITVDAYERMTVSEGWITRESERMEEGLVEAWFDEFGNPESFTYAVSDDVRALLQHAVRKHVESTQVWACEKVASRTFSATEIEEMFAEEIAREVDRGNT
jgi:hypothetical protein